MFATPAYAQAAGGAGSAFASFVPLILIFAIMYFLLIRPQQKKLKEDEAMRNALRRGDKVLTSGGIIGKVTKVVDDNEVKVEIASGTEVLTMTWSSPRRRCSGRSSPAPTGRRPCRWRSRSRPTRRG